MEILYSRWNVNLNYLIMGKGPLYNPTDQSGNIPVPNKKDNGSPVKENQYIHTLQEQLNRSWDHIDWLEAQVNRSWEEIDYLRTSLEELKREAKKD
jgi:hypothetical protein